MGRLRPGSRISSATYVAAFQPEYVYMIGTSARSQPVDDAVMACTLVKLAVDPWPTASATATNTATAVTVAPASRLWTTRPESRR